MNGVSSNDLLRQAIEVEGGMAISAGARVAHIRKAMETGRSFHVDLSTVPEQDRPALIAAIEELVRRATAAPERDPSKIMPDA